MPEDILQRILETKRVELQALLPEAQDLRARVRDAPPPRDLRGAFSHDRTVGVMSEIKRRSPGAGEIRPGLNPEAVARSYQDAGASAISVLTDRSYFGGGLEDLERVRRVVELPVFRKDFVIHPLQLLEARVAGADGALLIARILEGDQLRDLHAEALELGLTPLVEVHEADELDAALSGGATLVGINNRNLRTFETSLDVTLELLPHLPPEVLVVSESGIRTGEDVSRLGSAGVHGVLVGESLLRAEDPGRALMALVGRERRSREGSGG